MIIRKKIIISTVLIICFVIISCQESDEIEPPVQNKKIEAPKSMEVIKGDNQKGFQGEMLSETIQIKITPTCKEDIEHYTFVFLQNSYYCPNAEITEKIIVDGNLMLKISYKPSFNYSENHTFLYCYLFDKNIMEEYTPNLLDFALGSVRITVYQVPRWQLIYNRFVNYIGPGAYLDMHFVDENNGIAVGESGGFVKTSDGGNTWKDANYGGDIYQFCFFDKLNGIAIGVNNYAQYTNDGGFSIYQDNWTPPLVGHRSSGDYYMTDLNTIYTVGRTGQIAKSVDRGRSWVKYAGLNFINNLYSLFFVDFNNGYACGQVAKLIKTTDAGHTWKEIPIELNNNFYKVHFVNEKVGFIGGEHGILLRTDDGGNNWSVIEHPLINTFSITNIHFFSEAIGFVGTSSGGIIKTIDGGVSWRLICPNNYGANYPDKVYFKNEDTAFALQNGTIYKFNMTY